MNILWGDDQRTPDLNAAIGEFVASYLERDPFEKFTSMGVFLNGTMVCGVIFHNYNPDHGVIEISAAATTPRWLNRTVLRELYGYPFAQLGCQMVVQRVSERDTRQDRMLTLGGFDRVFVPRLRGRDEGEWIYTLTDDVWRTNKFYGVSQR